MEGDSQDSGGDGVSVRLCDRVRREGGVGAWVGLVWWISVRLDRSRIDLF